MAYADQFVNIRHSFLIDPRFTLEERAFLAWLASKPADWDVTEGQARAELGIGPATFRRLRKSLRAKDALTKPEREQQRDGTWRTPPGRLAIMAEIRHITAGRTEGTVSDVRKPYRPTNTVDTKTLNSPAQPGTDPAGSNRPDTTADPWSATTPGQSWPGSPARFVPGIEGSSPLTSTADGSEASERLKDTDDQLFRCQCKACKAGAHLECGTLPQCGIWNAA